MRANYKLDGLVPADRIKASATDQKIENNIAVHYL